MSRIIILLSIGGILLEILICKQIVKLNKLILPIIYTFIFVFVRFGELEILNIIAFASIWLIYILSLFFKSSKERII